MTANDSKSYLAYLNKLVDQNENTYHDSIDTNLPNFYLAAKKDFIALKVEVDKLEINKFVSLNNLKTKVDDLDVGKLKTVPVDLKILVMQSIMNLLKTQNSAH